MTANSPPHPDSPPSARPAVFFDRDGVVNVSPGEGYVTSWEAFQFSAGIEETIRLCRDRGCVVVAVSNQRGVATGAIPPETLDDIHRRMQEHLGEHGAAFDGIYVAAGDRDDPRRKPRPAMLREAARDLGIDLARSILIGDDDRDVDCARRAGLRAVIRVAGGKPVTVPADVTVGTVAELASALHELLER